MLSCAASAFVLSAADLRAQGQVPASPPGNPEHAKGMIPEPAASFASRPHTPRYRAFLPSSVDLSRYLPLPGKQGKQGSCVGWAVGYAARAYYAIAQEKRPGDARNIPSPAYIYNSIVETPGSCSQGSQISNALDLLKAGALSLADAPYNDRSCYRPTPGDKARATDFRIDNWLAVDPSSPDQVKGEIARGHPVVIGMETRPSFDDLKGDVVYRARLGEPEDGGHAMTVVGYDDIRQAFKIINSWGRDWGDGGYGWVAYDTFTKDVDEAYVMRPASGKIQPPQPQPAPSPQPQPAPAPPPPRPQTSFDFVKCGLVTARQGAKGLEVEGFVGTSDELKQVEEKARALKAASVSVAVRQWPQCEALTTLERGLTATDRPKVRVVRPEPGKALVAGDPFLIELESPPETAFLQVTVIQADGTAVHLLQPELAPMPPRTRQVLGDGRNGGPKFTVSAPFGDEIVIAVASKAPLFADKRPTTETERDYLTALRAAVLARPNPSLPPRLFTADVDGFRTEERKP